MLRFIQFSCLIIFSVVCAVRDEEFNEYRYITTDKGIVFGHLALDGDYFAFRGIPYAAPPIGDNRFQAPKPVEPWIGIYNANTTVECPQRDSEDVDCLMINVFTPIKIARKKLPVLVYIHGGAYIIGRGPVEGIETLIKNQIIVVTFNYRLGALGFLCLGTEFAPGNAGLKDQVAALNWVKDNIKHFGGDAKQVTIYGTSAGASSVELLVLFANNNKNEKLFQRAILESGSALNAWAVNDDPIATASAVYLNSKNPPYKEHITVSELEDFYRTESVLNLNKYTWEHYNSLTDGTFGFAVCVENIHLTSENPIVTVHPQKKLYDNDYQKVPMMMLFATLEGLFVTNDEFYVRNNVKKIQNNFHDYLPANLKFESDKTKREVGERIKSFYFDNYPVSFYKNNAWFYFLGDSIIMHGMMDSLNHHSDKNQVFLMEFSYKGTLGSFDPLFENITVAGHADLKNYALTNVIITKDDKLAVDRVTKLLANFVQFGNPTPFPSDLLPFLWPPAESGIWIYLRLDPNWQILDDPYPDRFAFWEHLYLDYGNTQYFNNTRRPGFRRIK